ncbi:hypothetical protein TNCT_421901 [Trichonephila clavata]|uniref:Uncharacterized protein n=1 Tax=Trichonephila clavata TaxID=2740835 RepID=A0A8X6HJT0_TRICU|nr:hypothetical protein TNCT_421901 [Trichonephila clavata]
MYELLEYLEHFTSSLVVPMFLFVGDRDFFLEGFGFSPTVCDYGIGEYGDKLDENFVYEKFPYVDTKPSNEKFESQDFSSNVVVFDAAVAVTIVPMIAASVPPADATYGAPIVVAKEQAFSSDGERNKIHSSP